MKLAELKDTMSAIAQEAPVGDVPGRLAGVEAKVKAARRGRLAAAGLAATVVVAMAAVVAQQATVSDSSSPDPVEHPQRSTELPVVKEDGVTFYRSPAGNTLVGSAVAEVGARRLDAQVTPTSTNLAIAVYCSGAEGMANVTVNGHPLYGESCSEVPGEITQPQATSGDGSPASNAAAWADDFGAVAGQPLDVSVRFRADDKQTPGMPQLGVAVYEMSGDKLNDHGVWVDAEVVVDGRTFGLVDSAFADFDDRSGSVMLPRPDGDGDVWAEAGVERVSTGYRVKGPNPNEVTLSQVKGGGRSGTMLDEDVRMPTAKVKTHGDPTGLVYLLLYTEVGQ